MAKFKTYYDILQISVRATQAQIKSAYRRAVKRTHPDRGGSQMAFEDIQRAYHILGNVTRRTAYDRNLLQATAGAYTATAPSASHARHRPARSQEGLWVADAVATIVPWVITIIPALFAPGLAILWVVGRYLWSYCVPLYRDLPARFGPVGPATFLIYPLIVSAYLIFATAMSVLVIGFGMVLLALTALATAVCAYLMVALKHSAQPFNFTIWQHYFGYEFIRLSGAVLVIAWQRSEPPADNLKLRKKIDRIHEWVLVLGCLGLITLLIVAMLFEPTLGLWPIGRLVRLGK